MYCKLFLWDLAGAERFRTVTNSYFRRADGLTLVYDITDRGSFERLPHWIHQIEQYKPGAETILIGSKCDLNEQRVVTFSEGAKLAEEHGFSFIEVSAKESNGVSQAYEVLFTNIISKRGIQALKYTPPVNLGQHLQQTESWYSSC